jgi:hypothetical protein
VSGLWLWLAQRQKAVAAQVGGVLSWVYVAWVPDGHIDRAEWFALAVMEATVFGVYGVTNAPPRPPGE